MNGLDAFTTSAERVTLYDFLARYVRKVYPDTEIMRDLKNNEGLSFIDKITPSDIAFVISVIKNGRNVWDESIRLRNAGMAVHAERGDRARPLSTGGKGKKKEDGMSLWSDQGMRYFKKTQKKWISVYVNEVKKREMYAEFEQWLNEYGKNVKVGKRVNKTLHLVLSRWISTEDRGVGHKNDNEEGDKDEEDEENEDEGYNSDIGYDLLSRRWSIEETKKQDKHDNDDYEGTDNDDTESEQEKERISLEMNERSGLRNNRISNGEQSVGSVGSHARGTRSHKARDHHRQNRKY